MTVGGRLALILLSAVLLSGCGQFASDKAACDAGLYAFKTLAIPKEQNVRWVLETGGELPGFIAPEEFNPDKFSPEQMPAPKAFWADEGEVQPKEATIRALAHTTLKGVENCSSVRDAAQTLNVLGAARNAHRKLGADGLYEVHSVTMSKPVLSPDGNEALLYVAYSSGPLAASGSCICCVEILAESGASWGEPASGFHDVRAPIGFAPAAERWVPRMKRGMTVERRRGRSP